MPTSLLAAVSVRRRVSWTLRIRYARAFVKKDSSRMLPFSLIDNTIVVPKDMPVSADLRSLMEE